MNLKILIRILVLSAAALLIVGIVTPLEKTSWAEAKRAEGSREQHERSNALEVNDKPVLEESVQQAEQRQGHRSQKEFSMKRIINPLAKEAVLMGIPFFLTLGVMKIWRWRSKPTH